MKDLDRLYFKKYAVDPESELDESDIYMDSWLIDMDKDKPDFNTLDETDWIELN
jgi:hypothetical protein